MKSRKSFCLLMMIMLSFLLVSRTDVYAAKKVSYSYKTETYKAKLENGLKMDSKCKYVVASGDGVAVKKINAYFVKQLKKWKSDNDKEKRNLKQNEDASFMLSDTTSIDYENKVLKNASKYLSVQEMSYAFYAGAAHPSTAFFGVAFDPSTGKRVTAAEVMGISKKSMKEKVYKKFLKEFHKDQERGWFANNDEDFKKLLDGINFNKTNFYIKGKYLYFFSNQYDLCDYASGTVSVKIKL